MRRVTPLKLAIVGSGRAQQDIAAQVGVHPSHLSRIVNGLHCDEATQDAIACALGVSVSSVFPDEHVHEAA